MSDAPAPRYARPFVAVFLVAIVACALATIEAWPLTAWELFSHLRTQDQTRWEATVVDADGVEHPYPLGSLPQGYRGFAFLMNGFADDPASRRAELCETWRTGAADLIGFEARAVRIYQLSSDLSDRDGERGAPPDRTLTFICRPGGVDAVA